MSLMWMVYLAGVADKFGVTLFLCMTGCVFAAFLVWINSTEAFPVPSRWLAAGALLLGLTAALTPSERTIYLMAGAHMGQQLAEGEVGDKVRRIVNQKLDELIERGAKR